MKFLLPLLLCLTLSQAHEPDPTNGLKHVAVSALITAFSHHFLYHYTNMDPEQTIMVSVGIAGLCGLGKELYDEIWSPGYFSISDMLYNSTGIFLVVVWEM